MDELAEAAGVARRTLYNQFTSKEEIFREMLLRVSGHLEEVFSPGVETQGDVEEVLRLVAASFWSCTGAGIPRVPANGGCRLPLVSVDRGGVRRGWTPRPSALRAIPRI